MGFLERNKYNLLIISLVMIFLGLSSSLIMNINKTASLPIAKGEKLYKVLLSDAGNNIEEVGNANIITGKNPNNYIWYSGHLWRAVSINEDNTIKVVTEEAVNTLALTDDIDYFLNDKSKNGFLGNLNNYGDYIYLKNDSIWTKYEDNRSLGSITKPKNFTQETNPVGLLTTYDYQISYNGTTDSIGNSYLNNDTNWATYSYDKENYMIVNHNGKIKSMNKLLSSGIRPAINLLSTIKVESGTGTKDDPYIIEKKAKDVLLNTRYSGEYVRFNNDLYRIVNTEEEITKLVAIDTIKNKKFSSESSLFDINKSDNIGYYLNHDWYQQLSNYSKELLTDGKFYVETMDGDKTYQDIAKNDYVTAPIGLLRYGELLSVSAKKDYYLITPYNKEYNKVIFTDSLSGAMKSNTELDIKVALYIRKDAKIKEGKGIKTNPFILTH